MSAQRLIVLVLCALALAAPCSAATAKPYDYLLVQGKIGDRMSDAPIPGVVIKLTKDAQSFEAVTDTRGVFLFDQLPVANYDLEIRTPDGSVLRGVQKLDPMEPGRARMKIKVGRGAAKRIHVEAHGEAVSLVTPPRTNGMKLWQELLIFLGVAGVLAL